MRTLGRKAGHAGWLCGIFLFQVAVGVPLAQGAEPGAAPPSVGDAAREIGKAGGPFGGCEPIGLTASGELVFPLECKKLIKKPAEAPVAAVDQAPAEDRTASTDARPVVPSPSAAADKPVASETAAVAPSPAEAKPAVAADKPEVAHKAVSLDPAAPAMPAASAKKPASTKVSAKTTSSKTMSGGTGANNAVSSRTTVSTLSKPSPGKLASSKSVVVAVKEPAAKTTQTEAPKSVGKDSSRPSAISAIKSMIVMAKPAAVASPVAARSQSEDSPRLRTAGMPACVQFRSYNATTRSYRGFDGHIYSCR